MSIKIKPTTRKFYNRWNYKISLGIKNARNISTKTLEYIQTHKHDSVILSLATDLHNFDGLSYAKRVETNIVDLYTNDRVFFEYFLKKYEKIVRLAAAPVEGKSPQDPHSILANKLPYDRYQYKVYLQPHRLESKEIKAKYLEWLETQKPKINLTDTVKDWFYKTQWNWDRRYMYVEDEQMLLMLKLKKPEAIGTVYTYKICDK